MDRLIREDLIGFVGFTASGLCWGGRRYGLSLFLVYDVLFCWAIRLIDGIMAAAMDNNAVKIGCLWVSVRIKHTGERITLIQLVCPSG